MITDDTITDGIIDINNLDPNDQNVYMNPDLVRLLDQGGQMIAAINLARNGKMVGGDYIRTLEFIMMAAGYKMDPDGVLSEAELQALEHFKAHLEDANFKETANELLEMIIGSPDEGKLELPAVKQLATYTRAAPTKKAGQPELIAD